MRYVLAIAILVSGLCFSDAWAKSDKQMALEATISMEQAIKTAVDSVPGGKPYEVEMDKENGRITYKIEIVDAAKKTYKVKVDAQTGKILEKN
ncbi:MAG TPA: PepSY domain-containing protein [Nitrospirales bacterium]|jgi:uncharacterized membrane protein YkoI|nr:PepSY domain-containing protein [Nitrospirales bacterium]